MKPVDEMYRLSFESWWKADPASIRDQILALWMEHGGPTGTRAEERLNQIVLVVRDSGGRVVGLSTAFKTYVQQLRNHFFAIRLMLAADHRIPGLTPKLLVKTRDFLESIHSHEDEPLAIGILTLVENPRLKETRNQAIWPASGMVYVGNSKEGHHLRVYYFKGARITP